MTGSGGSNDSISPNPAGRLPQDWFDIDSFLDDYVTDLGNQDPLEHINLDFSLPFPASKQPGGANHSLPRFTSGALPVPHPVLALKPPELDDFTMPEAEYASEEEPSVQEDVKPTRARGKRTTTRGGGTRAATSKSTAAASAGAKTERATEPRNVTQQRKHQALQEKNRRAQRRFRERQKNRVTELEDQVAALTAQLANVVAERDALAQRNIELESLVSNDFKVLNNNVPPDSPQQAMNPTTNSVSAQQRVLPPPAGVPMHQIMPIDIASGADSHYHSALCSQGMTLTPKSGASPVVLSPAELCTMSQPVLSMHFGALVKECARTLVEGSGHPDSAERLSQLVDQAMTLWHRVAQCNPTAGKQFATCALDEAARGSPADERAPQIVRSLALTDDQKADMCNLRKLFLQRVNTIAASVSSAVGQTSLGNNNSSSNTSGRSLAMHQLASRQASYHIMNSLQEEHITAVEFESTVTKLVLAPAQAAQLLIHSFPWPPDCLSLTTWVAAESGEPDALAALAAEAQARAAATAAAVAGGSSAAVMVPVTAAAGAARKPTTAGAGAGGSSMQSPFVLGNPCAGSLLAAAAVGATSSVNTCMPPTTRQQHR